LPFFDCFFIPYSQYFRDFIACFGCLVYSGVSAAAAAAGLFLSLLPWLSLFITFCAFCSNLLGLLILYLWTWTS
jgi:hypothetical protein